MIIAIAGFAAYAYLAPAPTYGDVAIPELTVEATADRVQHGQKLVLSNCIGCHQAEDSSLSGKWFDDVDVEKGFGKLYASNITQHKEKGIGNYTDGELYRLLRNGVKKDNNLCSVVMPRWAAVSDEDIYAMIAFLRSEHPAVQPKDVEHPAHNPSFVERALLKFVFRPLPTVEYPATPAITDTIEYGKYIASARHMCYACHSQDLETYDMIAPENSPNYMGGGYVFNTSTHSIAAPRLLMDEKSNVGKWSADEFVNAVKHGIRPSGTKGFVEPMHPYPLLDSAEVKAIYMYLKDYTAKH